MNPADPKRWHTREDSGLRLDRQGQWFHDGLRIEHPNIIEAFNRGLQPTEDGRFKLTFGWDWCYVQVEDAAYHVLAVDVSPEDRLSVRLSDRTAELLVVDTLAVEDDGVVSCRVKRGAAKARFGRDAQFALGSLLAEEDGGPVLRVGSRTVPVPSALLGPAAQTP